MQAARIHTDREIRIMIEAIVEVAYNEQRLLSESRHDEDSEEGPISSLDFTERGRETIRNMLYAISTMLVGIPFVGWAVSGAVVVLTATGFAEQYVIDVINGKINIDKFVEKLEDAAMKFPQGIPKVANILGRKYGGGSPKKPKGPQANAADQL